MQKSLYAFIIAGLLLSFASCKEQPVTINHSIDAQDSTYVAAVETPQSKKIFVMELTGVECPNCPDAAEMLEDLNVQHNNSLVIISLHSGVLTKPINQGAIKNKYDFRTDDGAAILNQIYAGDPGVKPAASFNKLKIGTNNHPYFIQSYSQNWSPKLTQDAMPFEDPVLINLTVNSKYNNKTGKYDISARVVYNKEMSGKQRLNLYLTESKIVDVQETSDPFNQFETNYEFKHVFRKAITGISGYPVLDSLSTKEAGRVFVFNTSYELEPNEGQEWNPANMSIAAFVSEESGDDTHVYQAAETPLKD